MAYFKITTKKLLKCSKTEIQNKDISKYSKIVYSWSVAASQIQILVPVIFSFSFSHLIESKQSF